MIIFLGNGDSDVMGVLSFNLKCIVITTAAITVMVTLALPFVNGVLSRKKKEKGKIE